MKTYNFSVFKDRIKPLSPTKGVSGNTNFYECTFEFSEDWNSLLAFAVFVGDAPYIAAILDGKCLVRNEVLEGSGEIYIGVYATNGEDNLLRISTNLIPFEVEEGAFREGNLPIAPSPDVWEKYIAAMNQTLIATKDARDKAQEHLNAAQASATDSTLSAYAASESADRAAKSETNANTSKEVAEGYAGDAEGYSKAAKDEVTKAKAEVENAKAEVKKAEGFASEAEGFKNQAQSYVVGAGMNAEKAEAAEENARKSEFESKRYAEQAMVDAEEIRNESKNIVHKTGDEQIQGIKDFINGLKTAKITSDGRIAIEATDAPVTIYANGEYLFYDNTIYINGKNILTDSPKYDSVSAEQITTKKIQGDAEGDYFEIQADGMNINSGSGVNISANTGININTHESPFLVNGKAIATEEYVNEALKDIGGGGSITIDDTPTAGSKNAVSSGGTYIELSRLNNSLTDAKADISNLITNKAEKSYVDSSIQQAILDSWAEVVNP